MSKRDEEELCRIAFDSFLHSMSPSLKLAWNNVQDDPPDFFLDIDGQRFAVEVTTLMEDLDVGTHKVTQVGVWDSVLKLVKKVESEALTEGVLSGSYIVGLGLPVADLRSNRAQIESDLLDYVSKTQDLGDAPKERVYQEGIGRCDIQKVHDLSNQIELAGTYQPKWEGEAAIQICQLLEERIATKKSKLQSINFPKILLLYDGYRYADDHHFKNCVSQLSSLTTFHSVYVVRGVDSGFLLYSLESDWQTP